jgi:hypothetical protein
LILKKCSYWIILNGAPVCSKRTAIIPIPVKNMLSIEQLRNIAKKLSNGIELKYEL